MWQTFANVLIPGDTSLTGNHAPGIAKMSYELHVHLPLAASTGCDDVVASIGQYTEKEEIIFPEPLKEYSGFLLTYRRDSVEECEALLFAIRCPAAAAEIYLNETE